MNSKLKALAALTVTYFACVATPLTALAEGGDGSGGGFFFTNRIDSMVQAIGEDGSKLKVALSRYIQALHPFDEVNIQDQGGKNLLRMIKHSLKEDIRKSPYSISSQRCYDENGVEVHASTKRVNLFANPNAGHPEVCINLPKLVADSAHPSDLIGLMFHEHARHYGFEDTDKFGRHQIALFVRNNSDRILTYKNSNLFEFMPEQLFKVGPGFFVDLKSALVLTTDDQPVELVFDSKEGACKKLQIAPRSSADQGYWKKFANRIALLKANKQVIFAGLGIFGGYCKAQVHFEKGGLRSPTVTLEGKLHEGLYVDTWILPINTP